MCSHGECAQMACPTQASAPQQDLAAVRARSSVEVQTSGGQPKLLAAGGLMPRTVRDAAERGRILRGDGRRGRIYHLTVL